MWADGSWPGGRNPGFELPVFGWWFRVRGVWLKRGDNDDSSAPILSFLRRVQDHRKLRVWSQAQSLAIAVRRATRRFPRSGYGSLQSQITRAAESIVLTIVEGCGAASQREFARFLDMAVKSSSEVEAQLELAMDYGVLDGESWDTMTKDVVSIRRQLCSLRTKVLAAVKPATANPKPETQNLDSGSR
ncbi:MAG TPA: four helix bundle protein [Gemmatimonadaceae bacterium]|nr:four helix bundle protein [Gemmatimonadaceae bacterium]